MFEERLILPGGRRVELRFDAGGGYRLACRAGAQVLVAYAGDGGGHRREVRGRRAAYEFRSVEQLRYDFERDVADTAPAG
jgi:hypothetical protein